ncbi:MAG: zinc ribbon domain-containing protein [Thermoproteota archaeon]
MNKSDILAIGVLLIAISLFLRINIEALDPSMKTYLLYFTPLLFSAGLIVVVVSILIRPKKVIIPRAAEEEYGKEAAYGKEEPEETGVNMEQTYVEEEPVEEIQKFEETEEAYETAEEEPRRISEVVGICPRCGAAVREGSRYCSKCGLKLR